MWTHFSPCTLCTIAFLVIYTLSSSSVLITASLSLRFTFPHFLSNFLCVQTNSSIQYCMAVRLLSYEVADLCLGKPPLRSLSVSSTVGDALATLKSADDNYISVWSCDHSSLAVSENGCRCIGKVCMVDVICYLSREDNLSSPSSALKSPVSILLSDVPGLVRHVEPSSRYWITFLSRYIFLFMNFTCIC